MLRTLELTATMQMALHVRDTNSESYHRISLCMQDRLDVSEIWSDVKSRTVHSGQLLAGQIYNILRSIHKKIKTFSYDKFNTK